MVQASGDETGCGVPGEGRALLTNEYRDCGSLAAKFASPAGDPSHGVLPQGLPPESCPWWCVVETEVANNGGLWREEVDSEVENNTTVSVQGGERKGRTGAHAGWGSCEHGSNFKNQYADGKHGDNHPTGMCPLYEQFNSDHQDDAMDHPWSPGADGAADYEADMLDSELAAFDAAGFGGGC